MRWNTRRAEEARDAGWDPHPDDALPPSSWVDPEEVGPDGLNWSVQDVQSKIKEIKESNDGRSARLHSHEDGTTH